MGRWGQGEVRRLVEPKKWGGQRSGQDCPDMGYTHGGGTALDEALGATSCRRDKCASMLSYICTFYKWHSISGLQTFAFGISLPPDKLKTTFNNGIMIKDVVTIVDIS